MRAQPVATPARTAVSSPVCPSSKSLARRMAASMPNSIDIGDLVQDGVLGLIDAAHRFDEDRGIKFETFAERRVRGAMIDALQARRLAARRASPAARARRGARSAATRARPRAVDWPTSPRASDPTRSV